MITLTASPRSAVTHGVDARNLPTHPSNSTICGREITDEWAGEMSEEVAPGLPTCKRCAANADAGYPRTAPAPLVGKFAPGQRVGILAGFMAAGGTHVVSYGTVVRLVSYWRGTVDYIVADETTGEELVYSSYMLTDAPLLPADDVLPALVALVSGNPWNPRPRTLADSVAAHPAGRNRPGPIRAREVTRILAADAYESVNRRNPGTDPYTGETVAPLPGTTWVGGLPVSR